MATITRSEGLATGVGPWVVGGGYSGSTKELDDTVKKAAEMLSKEFGRDVEIRFNSDRRSGGAWLKDDEKGFSGNVQVGLGAAIMHMPPKGKTRRQWHKELGEKYDWGREMDAEIKKAPEQVVVDSYVTGAVAKNARILNNEGGHGKKYASHEHPSLRAGLTFLKRNVDRSKVNPYKGERLSGAKAAPKDEEITVGLGILKRQPRVSPLKGKTLTAVKGISGRPMRVPLDEVEVTHPVAGANAFWYNNKRVVLTPDQQAKVLHEATPKSEAKPEPKKETKALKARPTMKQSDRGVAIDRSLLARQVVSVDDPRWLRHPNRYDVRGIDTPGSGRVTSRTGFADKGKTRMSRRHHRGWKKIRM